MTIYCITKSATEKLRRFRLKGELVAFSSGQNGEHSFVLSVWLRWPNRDESYVVQLTHKRKGRVAEAICLPMVGGGKSGVVEAVVGAVLGAEADPLIHATLVQMRGVITAKVESFQAPPSELERLTRWMIERASGPMR